MSIKLTFGVDFLAFLGIKFDHESPTVVCNDWSSFSLSKVVSDMISSGFEAGAASPPMAFLVDKFYSWEKTYLEKYLKGEAAWAGDREVTFERVTLFGVTGVSISTGIAFGVFLFVSRFPVILVFYNYTQKIQISVSFTIYGQLMGWAG